MGLIAIAQAHLRRFPKINHIHRRFPWGNEMSLHSKVRFIQSATEIPPHHPSWLSPKLRNEQHTSRRWQHQQQHNKVLSRSLASSPFDPSSSSSPPQHLTTAARRTLEKFVPRKAAVKLTEQARIFFRRLLENPPRPEIIGIMLHYNQSSTGEPRMVFSLQFVTADELRGSFAEGVTLEVQDDGMTPKTPRETWSDALPKLYVHQDAFLKVLGATLDVNLETIAPILYDREGNVMDPNA
jgi:hypothetical protein